MYSVRRNLVAARVDVTIQVNEIRNPGCRLRHGNDRCVHPTVWAADSCAALHWNCVVVLGPPRTVDGPEVEVSDSTGGSFGRFRERHYLLRVSDLPTVCRSYAEGAEDRGSLRRYRCVFVSRGSRGSNFRRGSFAHSACFLRLSRDNDVGCPSHLVSISGSKLFAFQANSFQEVSPLFLGSCPFRRRGSGVWAAGFDRGIGQRQRGRARVRFAAALQAAFSR